MKWRWATSAVTLLAFISSGCYCHHPCWGYRLHPWSTPACYYPPRKPLLHHRYYKWGYPVPGMPYAVYETPPAAITASPSVPVVAYPIGAYPPIVGQPTPLPSGGSNGAPSNGELPHPMPMKKDQ
ncbi:MAG: hypothetical protein RMJ88_01020 [Thermogemmata sp.]|nr:hypothetical protein [Thermogemmata sp.]